MSRMDVMCRDFKEEEKSTAQRQGGERPALQETIPGSSAKRRPWHHGVVERERHPSAV